MYGSALCTLLWRAPSPLACTAASERCRRDNGRRSGRRAVERTIFDGAPQHETINTRCSLCSPSPRGVLAISPWRGAIHGHSRWVTRSTAGDKEEGGSSLASEGADLHGRPSSAASDVSATLASLDALLGTTTQSVAGDDRGIGADPSPVVDEEASSGSQSLIDGRASGVWRDADEGGGSGGLDAEKGSDDTVGLPLAVPKVSPRVSYIMLGINLTVYAIGAGIALAGDAEASNSYFLSLACDHSAVAAGEYGRLLTSTFMHAGLLHLGLNCAALLAVAPEAEAVLGYSTFSFIYLAAGLSGSIASFLLTDSVTVGASGAIFGLLGALIAYFARNPGLERSTAQLLFLALVSALNLGIGLDGDGLVDNSGHVAGLLAGGWLGWGMGPRWVRTDNGTVVNGTPRGQALAVAVSFASSLPLAVAVGVAAQLADAAASGS